MGYTHWHLEGMMGLLLLWLFACTPTPEVYSLDPHTVDPGQTVRVLGEKFDSTATVSAIDARGLSHPIEEITIAGAGVIEATVPQDLGSGAYTLRVEQAGKSSTSPKKLSVRTVEGELLCGRQRTVAEYSQVRKEVAIERFDPTRDPERTVTRLALESIERVEYEVLRSEAGDCRVIRLKTTDGRRVVFADDDSEDLEDRAWSLAQAMGKPVESISEAL